MAGAQGEFAGVAMIRAYHRARGDLARNEIIVPDGGARHQSRHRHDVRLRRARDSDQRQWRCGPRRAARRRGPADRRHHADQSIDARRVRAPHRGGRAHRARGGRPAVLRRRQPQRHPRQGAPGRHGLRRHPHEPAQDLLHAARRRRARRGRGGRGAATAAVPAAADRGRGGEGDGGHYRWLTEKDLPQSIGRLSAFMGNAGVLLRAYVYARMLGAKACTAWPSSPRSTPTT